MDGATITESETSRTDQRKSARLAAERVCPAADVRRVTSFPFARHILRHPSSKQAGAGAEEIVYDNPEHAPVFFLEGEAHRAKRVAISRYLTPKSVTTRYRDVMDRASGELLGKLQAEGGGRLDDMSFQLAVAVASEVVGLTNSDIAERAGRIHTCLKLGIERPTGFFRKIVHPILRVLAFKSFFSKDVKPAIQARKKQRQEDILSHLIDEGYSDLAMLTEMATYGSAAMMTTREFITMCAWYLFDSEELKQTYLEADEAGQLAILFEILRLEPVAAMLQRRGEEAFEVGAEKSDAGTLFGIDLRAVNTDPEIVGACPYQLDLERAKRQKDSGRFMSFGDGSHSCPGWQLALHETRVFLDYLFRVPGLKLERAPDMGWNEALMSYELRNAIISCDKTG